MTIKEVSHAILNNFELNKRQDGTEYYALKDNIDWQQNIIMQAHLGSLPDDYYYKTIYSILLDFEELPDDATEEDFREILYQKEPSPYTKDLTEWLNNDVNNVLYLTEVLEEFDIKDGFQLLSLANYKFIQAVGNALLDAIIEFAKQN